MLIERRADVRTEMQVRGKRAHQCLDLIHKLVVAREQHGISLPAIDNWQARSVRAVFRTERDAPPFAPGDDDHLGASRRMVSICCSGLRCPPRLTESIARVGQFGQAAGAFKRDVFEQADDESARQDQAETVTTSASTPEPSGWLGRIRLREASSRFLFNSLQSLDGIPRAFRNIPNGQLSRAGRDAGSRKAIFALDDVEEHARVFAAPISMASMELATWR